MPTAYARFTQYCAISISNKAGARNTKYIGSKNIAISKRSSTPLNTLRGSHRRDNYRRLTRDFDGRPAPVGGVWPALTGDLHDGSDARGRTENHPKYATAFWKTLS